MIHASALSHAMQLSSDLTKNGILMQEILTKQNHIKVRILAQPHLHRSCALIARTRHSARRRRRMMQTL
jgi:hypothetical protein